MKQLAIKELMRECSAYITEKTKDIHSLVAGSGNTNSKIMFIAPCPSAEEEATGNFFEGGGGEAFDAFLERIAMKREDIYLTYAVKYRPYKVNAKTGRILSRNLEDDEIKMFLPFLHREIELIKPMLIIPLGPTSHRVMHNLEPVKSEDMGIKMTVHIHDKAYQEILLPHPSETAFVGATQSEELLKDLSDFKSDIKAENQVEEEMAKKIKMGSIKLQEKPPVKKKIVLKQRKPRVSGKRKVILIYGGNNLANDPTLVAAERVSSVLTELNVSVKRLDLYQDGYNMEDFFEALSESEGVILATTITWYGIGGLMQSFLDKCYDSGQFACFEGVYLFGIAISKQAYERDALSHLLKSWDILGGVEGTTLCASIENSADLETDKNLLNAIDKKAEDYYRVLNQQRNILPTSIRDNKILMKLYVPSNEGEREIESEGEGIGKEQGFEGKTSATKSQISNYDEFIEKQQKDIEDIASLFKERLSNKGGLVQKTYPELFEYKFKPDKTFPDCIISWVIEDKKNESFILDFKSAKLKSKFGTDQEADVVMNCNHDIMKKITEGRLTVQRAFMTGEIKAKGNFTLLYKLDQLFAF
ncbi:uracil-DNA glycosylase family protein [Petrocella sp. FN5]|uniref:uracil-DNA glycosylase family protein n=1 Tax=Petrocella sp. FN5 TaxID=3032002 RepID=UPI0023DBEDE6|nr:uracil-DNA glycosylase family protein [Petrocella sp. FN5]MDF1618008.1 uracil-DNA glycosylase family protein [Petrocella sp. FN5]